MVMSVSAVTRESLQVAKLRRNCSKPSLIQINLDVAVGEVIRIKEEKR
jgi:hypothetical protein